MAALAAATAILGSVAVSAGIASAAAGDPPAGTATLSPTTGTSDSNFAFQVPFGATCPGDANTNWRWSAIVVPRSADIGALTFSVSGIVQTPAGQNAALYRSLRIGGTNLVGEVPSLDNFLINPSRLNNVNLSGAALVPGDYTMAVACYQVSGTVSPLQTGKFYKADITVAAATGAGLNNYIWGQPAVPSAPTLTPATPPAITDPVPTINYSLPPTIGALSNLTATVTPTSPAGPALPAINIPIASQAFPNTTGSFTVPGLTLGTTYSVTVTATNSTGTGVASNAVTLSPSVFVTPGPVVAAASAFEGVAVPLNWTAPATGPTPTSYDVAVTGPSPATATVFSATGVSGTTVTIPAATALALGDYTVTVTANYPAGTTAAPGVGTLTVNPNTLLYQDISVERPAGALVLTQRCGVYGAFPAFDGATQWPGAQLALESLTAVTGLGTAPTVVGGPNAGQPDPLFSSYPQRGTYPTLCGVDLGTSELVTAGPLAGRYYAADGRINQVTVLDTRDGDLGWNARGDIADLFTAGSGPYDANNSFTGDFLGWFPQVTSTSAGQTVVPGAPIGPGTAGGLTGNPTLASAAPGVGLGIAALDARLSLIIPVAADEGDYSARLSLTVS